MTQNNEPVNATIAPLANVALLMAALTGATHSNNDDRLVVIHGHAGYGKTTAVNFARNKFRGIRVECCNHWGRKALLQSILYEMGLPSHGNINDMFNQVVEQLAISGRPLMIDEADHLVKNSCIELVRDIHDKSKVVVLLSGEEMLPKKLERWERVHSRVLDWVRAEPADLNDVRHLANLYCRNIEVADDWLVELHRQTGGNTRRVCVNLNRARTEAEHLGRIDLAGWADRGWYTGKSPAPRKAV